MFSWNPASLEGRTLRDGGVDALEDLGLENPGVNLRAFSTQVHGALGRS